MLEAAPPRAAEPFNQSQDIQMHPGRNDPCPCGSGKKFKRCCGASTASKQPPSDEIAKLFALGQRAHREGLLDKAETAYRAILRADPVHANAIHYLGMVALQTGNLENARALVTRSLMLSPRDADYWSNLGVICERCDDPLGAEKAYREAVHLAPHRALTWFNLGNVARRLDRSDESSKAFLEAVRLDPLLADAWMNLGNVYLSQAPRNLEEALRCFVHYTHLRPQRGEGYSSLGVAHIYANHLSEAMSALDQAVRLSPDSPSAWFNLAHLHLLRDDSDAALHAYERAVTLSPDTADFYKALAQALRSKGQFDMARSFVEKAYEFNPGDLSALALLVENQRVTEIKDSVLERARAVVDHAPDDKAGVADLCFSLGTVLDRLNDFDAAFSYYTRGNRLRREEEPFDRMAYHRYVDHLIKSFGHASIARLRQNGNPSSQPIYIVGMPRSGTTLTEQIIASHPHIVGGGERNFWHLAESRLGNGLWNLDAKDMAEIAQEALADLTFVRGDDTTQHVTDKMPGNFLRLGLIHVHFPNAKIIHVRRHPVDNCLSIFFQNFAGNHPYAYGLEDLAFYRREYERLMTHWREVIPADRYFEFDYEDLVADQEGVSRKLVEFCGLEWDEACLRYFESERVVRTASIWQVRQKIYSSSVERWRNYEKHIGPLLSLLAKTGSDPHGD